MNYLTKDEIDVWGLYKRMHSAQSGAVVLFSGEVRGENKGKSVNYINYEAYDAMAEKLMQEIVDLAKIKFNLNAVEVIHRTGKVDVMESAVLVLTASAHRKEAYDANQYIINRIKAEVPIWKMEVFADGSVLRGNNCECKKHNNGIPFLSLVDEHLNEI